MDIFGSQSKFEIIIFFPQYLTLLKNMFQFRALSDQLYRTPEHHEFVRQQIIAQVNFSFY